MYRAVAVAKLDNARMLAAEGVPLRFGRQSPGGGQPAGADPAQRELPAAAVRVAQRFAKQQRRAGSVGRGHLRERDARAVIEDALESAVEPTKVTADADVVALADRGGKGRAVEVGLNV